MFDAEVTGWTVYRVVEGAEGEGRMKPIEPHDGIYTFVDCPDRERIKDYDDGGMLSQCRSKLPCTGSCEYNRHPDVRICPRGYP